MLKNLRLGTKISIGSSLILVLMLTVGAVAVVSQQFSFFEKNTLKNIRQHMDIIEDVHTQAMLNRGEKLENNPVIKTLNNTLDQLSKPSKHMNVWLVMGPKVVAYQKNRGSSEIEPPKDVIDQEALRTKKTVARFVGKNIYRITRPVILGEGIANNKKCIKCHGRDMGLRKGDVIGAYSISHDVKEEYNNMAVFGWTVLLSAAFIAMLASIIISLLLNRVVGNPIVVMTKTMNRLVSGDLEVVIPNKERTDELGDLAKGLEVFKTTAIVRQRAQAALRDNENRLRTIMDNVVDGIIIIDQRGIIRDFNNAAERIFGYPAGEVLGQNVNILMPSPYAEEHDGYLNKYIRTGKANIIGYGSEVEGLRKDGEIFPLDLAISEVLMDGRQRFIGIVRDITVRHRAEVELLNAKKQAEAASQAKSEFMANMSHELRTPLNAIMGFSETMLCGIKAEMTNPQHKEYVRHILDSGQHLLKLVNQVLDISRIEENKLDLDSKPFELVQFLGSIVEAVTPAMAKNSNEFKMVCEKNIGEMIGDSTRVRQVLNNLLDNAAKFTEKGVITLDVKRRKTSQESEIIFTVSDTGMGMTASQLEAVFEPFTQADSSISKSYGGTGLGLAISRELCLMMGGNITGHCVIGEGCTFVVTIPQSSI